MPIEALTNRTEPSPNAKLAPPGWWLAKPPTYAGLLVAAALSSPSPAPPAEALAGAGLKGPVPGRVKFTADPVFLRLARVPDAQPRSRPSLSFSPTNRVDEVPSVTSS